MSRKVIAVLGVGPGLGLSMAHRFGREGFVTALVSRNAERHEGYRASLSAAGIESRGYVADVADEGELRGVLARIASDLGEIDTVYFGPGNLESGAGIVPITELDAETVRGPYEATLIPPVNAVAAALPPMLERGDGALFFAGGLSGKYPMPLLGSLAPATAALRMYVLTLAAALEGRGVYAATLTIGGLIERGDIHRFVQEHAARTGEAVPGTLDPDDIADTAWNMYVARDRAEAEFNALTQPV
ncbi:SDR family NAD(P)-dependent oxidoreductase [Nonomuraea sp. NPDC000554]|uniref:SDR family NAD(P)-dependent oxidoreductase n=1 Tax=Nonomuraea sp. NPDC000554 TaxID=3154259 RepID=UPI0033170322